MSESTDAVMNIRPAAATIKAVQPILSPGISANNETASALLNPVSAADARTR